MDRLKKIGSFETDGIKYDVRGDGLYYLDTDAKKYIKIPEADITEGQAFNMSLAETQNTTAEVATQLSKWTAELLDEQAQLLKYDDIKSVRTYTGYPNIYQIECVELAKWSSNMWYVLSKVEPKVIDGSLTITSKDELKAQLPKYVPGE